MSLPLYRPFETVSLENAVEDLVVRFILNVPPEDLATVERVLFHFEEASWFYTDFVKLMNPYLPNLSIRRFAKLVKDTCPLVWKWDITPEEALVKFSKYKQTIPVRGAAIFNETLSKLLLLKGSKSKYWSFPRGKIGKDEDDVTCCIREVKEETGFDLTGYINEDQYVERNMNGKNFKIFLVKGVPEDFEFKPEHKNEIEMIEWKDFRKLSKSVFKNDSSAKFFLVNSMIRPLSLYVKNEKRSQDEKRLRQYAEDHLKILLGLNSNENKIVLDAGREIMDMIQKSAKKSNKDTSQNNDYQDSFVNVQQARDLFPLMSMPSSGNIDGRVSGKLHEGSLSPASSPMGGLQSSSKELLAFLRKASEGKQSSRTASPDSLSSFPSAPIDFTQRDNDYEEFESSSEEDGEEAEEEEEEEQEQEQEQEKQQQQQQEQRRRNMNFIPDPPAVLNFAKEENNFNSLRNPTKRENATIPKPKLSILKRPEPCLKPSNEDTVPAKPKIRLLKRGDKIEDLVPLDSKTADKQMNSTKQQMSEEPQPSVSNNESPYSNILLSLLKKSDETLGEGKTDEPSNKVMNMHAQESSLMRKTSVCENSNLTPMPQQSTDTEILKNLTAQLEISQSQQMKQNEGPENSRSQQFLEILKRPEPKSQQSANETSPKSGRNELLTILKRQPVVTKHLSPPDAANSLEPQTNANELLNVLKNPNVLPTQRNSTENRFPQGQPNAGPSLPFTQSPMNGYDNRFPQHGYVHENMQFGGPGFQTPQQFMYPQPPQQYVVQSTAPHMTPQPMQQSHELLNLLKNPSQSRTENTVSASSELLSILRK